MAARKASPAGGRPLSAELLAAAGKTVPDVIRPGLKVLFCGINPGLYTAKVGHHFGRPGNRFWPALYAAGFTPRLLHPSEQALLLGWGYGITNIVARATATADELRPEEYRAGGAALAEKVARYAPRWLAVLGIGAYRKAFFQKAALGPQPEPLGPSRVWVLPNPSGLNAHYSANDLAALFAALRQQVESDSAVP